MGRFRRRLVEGSLGGEEGRPRAAARAARRAGEVWRRGVRRSTYAIRRETESPRSNSARKPPRAALKSSSTKHGGAPREPSPSPSSSSCLTAAALSVRSAPRKRSSAKFSSEAVGRHASSSFPPAWREPLAPTASANRSTARCSRSSAASTQRSPAASAHSSPSSPSPAPPSSAALVLEPARHRKRGAAPPLGPPLGPAPEAPGTGRNAMAISRAARAAAPAATAWPMGCVRTYHGHVLDTYRHQPRLHGRR